MRIENLQDWIYSQIQIESIQNYQNQVIVAVSIFGEQKLLQGNGLVFCFESEDLEEFQELCISNRAIENYGSLQEALRMRILELFISSIGFNSKQERLYRFSPPFQGVMLLFEWYQASDTSQMTAPQLLECFTKKQNGIQEEKRRKKMIKNTINEAREALNAFSKRLLNKLERLEK